MVTDVMLKDAAIEAESVLLTALAETDGEEHVFSDRFEKKIRRLMNRFCYPVRYYAKRAVLIATAVACLLFLLNPRHGKFKRISFDAETLGETLAYIDENTVVINNTKETFPTQLPIYEITPHNITQQEFDETVKALNLPGNAEDLEFEKNRFYYCLTWYTDAERGYFNMTDEEVEKAAWEVLGKIPFLKGEFEYLGIKRKMMREDSTGVHITRAGVQFQLKVDGYRVAGNEDIVFYFDGSGLVEIQIKWFDYKQIGTMDLVPLADAEARIKTPDDFNLEATTGKVQTLQVDQTNLLFVNQYNSGCEILQPIYVFSGTAQMRDGAETEFSSKVIAIPEKYTYEAD